MTNLSAESFRDRRLVAIMFTDIVGYTSMMQRDEKGAVDTIEQHRLILEKYTQKHQGEILQYYGDGSLSIFPSAIEAVECALEVQKDLIRLHIPLRIGIHLGDVKIKGESIFGDGVNVASRVQSLGVSGSVLITDTIYHLIRNQSNVKTVSLGSFNLKNVDQPKFLYALEDEFLSVPNKNELPRQDFSSRRKTNWTSLAVIAVLAVLLGYFAIRFFIQGDSDSVLNDKSIAVLPFDNLSNDPEQEYFSDGITEDIINHLAKIEALKVKSRTTTEQYKNPGKTIPVIGHELGVSYILEGSVRKIDNKVRIVAQLIDVKNDVHVWTETYDREMVEIFDIQSNIAVEIAQVLEARLTNEEQRHIRGRSREKMNSSDITAYDYLLKARNAWREWNDEKDLENALELVDKAIEMDPVFAPAYVLKGTILHHGMREFGVPNTVWIDQALDLADKAIEIDSMLSGAYLLKGNILSEQDWNSDEALKTLIKAYRLEPGNPNVLESLGNVHMRRGDYEKGASKIIKSIERQFSIKDPEYYYRWGNIYFMMNEPAKAEQLYLKAINLNPKWLAPYYNLGQMYRYGNNLDMAEKTFRKALEIAPYDQQTLDALGWVHLQAGDLKDASKDWSSYEEIERQYTDTSQYLPFRHRLGYVQLLQGDTVSAYKLIKEQLTRDLERHQNLRGYGVWPDRGYYYDLAASYAFLGQKEEALAWLDSAAQMGFMSSWYLENDPLFNNIRNESEFKRIKTDYEAQWQRQVEAFRKAINETNYIPPEIKIKVGKEPSL